MMSVTNMSNRVVPRNLKKLGDASLLMAWRTALFGLSFHLERPSSVPIMLSPKNPNTPDMPIPRSAVDVALLTSAPPSMAALTNPKKTEHTRLAAVQRAAARLSFVFSRSTTGPCCSSACLRMSTRPSQ